MPPENEPTAANVISELSEIFPAGSAEIGLEKIRTRLLDLTARNKLLNFRHPKSSCLRFVDTSLDQVFQHLIDGNTLQLEAVPDPVRDKSGIPPIPRIGNVEDDLRVENDVPPKDQAAKSGWRVDFDLDLWTEESPRLRVLAYTEELDSKCRKLATMARTAIEESGANLLYLCFGFLEWKDGDADQSCFAPLLILPVMMEREKSQKGTKWIYNLQYSGEDLPSNLSLIEKLRRDFALELPMLSDEDTPSSYMKAVSKAISDKQDWHVRNQLTLALLGFGKLLMFLDLDPSRWPSTNRITNHEVIRALFEGTRTSQSAFPDEYAIDEYEREGAVPSLFYDADSSQHSALIDALLGKNLVVEGPPGTGKSQTITNLIACALSEGKSVLFVAEKMAALEVVSRRLNAIGLGFFCLELHSHKTQKREMLSDLEQRLSARDSFGDATSLEYKLEQIRQTKLQLNAYVRVLNTPHPHFGSTTFEIIWARHRAALGLPELTVKVDTLLIRDHERLARSSYEQGKHATNLFSVLTAEIVEHWPTLKDHPWYWLQNSELGYVEQSELVQLISSIITCGHNFNASLQRLEQMGLSLNGSLRDLAACRVWQECLPLPSSDVHFSILPTLASCASRHSANAFCDHIVAWRSIRSDLENLADLKLATLARPSVFEQLRSLVRDCEATEISLLELELHADRINDLRSVIPPVVALLNWANERLPPQLSRTRQDLEQLRAVLATLAAARESDVQYRHLGLLSEDSVNTLQQAKKSADDLRLRRSKLDQTFELSNLPAASQLQDHAAALADSNLLTRWFRRDCRYAKSAFRRLSKVSKSTSHQLMIDGLRDIAEYKSRSDMFDGEMRFRVAAGPHYAGLDTPWNGLLASAEWLATVASRSHSESSHILTAIVTMPRSEINLLREQVADRQFALEATNRLIQLTDSTARGISQPLQISWSSSIESLADTVQEVERRVRELITLGYETGLKNILKLDHVRTLFELCQRESGAASEAQRLAATLALTDIYRGTETDVRALQQVIKFAAEVDKAPLPNSVRQWLLSDFKANGLRLNSEILAYSECLSELERATIALAKISQMDVGRWCGHQDVYDVPLDVLLPLLEQAYDKADELPMFVDWLRAWHTCLTATLPDLPRLVVDGTLSPNDLPAVYEYIFYNSLVNDAFAAHSDLMLFKGLAHERLRAVFAGLDREIMSLNAKNTAHVIDSRLIPHGRHSGPVSQWTDLALIRHELSKQKRHLPIRRLVNRAGHALKALKPCFLMSPLSVAQYLEPGHLQFDLVIMDEASQLKPEDALGAIARGKQVVIVGDPKQLPPTTFFERTINDESSDEELTAVEDAESILDVASSIYQPIRRLRWHYRSRHHTLIEFSNHEFYQNLVVFPSAHSEHPDLGVRLTEVPAGRFVNRRNVTEAEVVVKAAIEHMRSHPNESLGIVALNFEQRELIDDLLDHETMCDPFAEQFILKWKNESEPLFVKNLENVQGDERDVIFISTTYGPNESGKQFQRFGPINGPSGHRRLNVLFTRAKRRVQVFSSLQPSNIITDGSSWGVRALKQYLEFAKSGSIRDVPNNSGGDADSDFEISVAHVIKGAGYDVVPQVGVAGFFIDMGVREQANTGFFLAGIECDGATYHSAKSARDRDRLRQEILETHGWRIYRIWSTDWFKNRRHEETRLLQFLAAARLDAVQANSVLHREARA